MNKEKIVAFPGLRRLLGTFPIRKFLEEHWEKEPLHIVRSNPEFYSDLFSLKLLDEFHGFSLTNDNSRMAKDGKSQDPSSIAKLNICHFYESYYKGHTLVTCNIHERWEPIAEIANALFKEFGCKISTHLYPTPAHSQGFGAHWDDHDIFALQLEGEKEWALYNGGPKTPRLNAYDRDSPRQSIEDPGEPYQTILLEAGDLLYFPRGVIHRAKAQEKASLHLTFGLYSTTLEHVMKEAIEIANLPELDRSLPLGFFTLNGETDHLQEQMISLSSSLIQSLDFEQALTRIAARIVRNWPPLPTGHFTQLGQVCTVNLNSRVKKRKGNIGILSNSETGIVVSFPGGEYEMDHALRPALRFLCDREETRVGDLPGEIDNEMRIGLVGRLLERGFLDLVG
jgi:ribosomal protein L16 Arg81 hydroxylase